MSGEPGKPFLSGHSERARQRTSPRERNEGSPEGVALWRGTGLAQSPVGTRRAHSRSDWRLKTPGTLWRACFHCTARWR